MTRLGTSRAFRALLPAVVSVAGVLGAVVHAPAASASQTLVASGSSFAGPEIQQWARDVSAAPYNLNINYTSSSSGDGRYEFANQTVDFGVSDIPFQPTQDSKVPSFPFIYIPVTAGGLAFMYHINGLSSTLKLSSYSACAIFTGAAATWNSPIIQADNPGVSLPNIPIHPVTRSDLAGTNFVFQEYCIDEQPALWAAFVNSKTVQSYPGQVGDLSATSPRSDWPLFPTAIPVSGSSTAADTVANTADNGDITAVETAYAIQHNFNTTAEGVALVKNASGDYTSPAPVDVASALAYATQLPDGTHQLNFNGTGPHVYNPSTYSYLMAPTTGWSAVKGAVLSQFVNFSLTLGQQPAPAGYASLGLSLERYGVDAFKANVPGAVPLTAAEQAGYAAGDLTVAEVQAGQTTVSAGVTTPTAAVPNGGNTTATSGTTANTTKATSSTASTSKTSSHATSPISSASGATTGSSGSDTVSAGSSAVDPSVSLSGAAPSMAMTGGDPLPFVYIGVALLLLGWLGRRLLVRRSAREAS